ncbi:hypothetical protein ACFE04_013810 [Oxalis oulophora]
MASLKHLSLLIVTLLLCSQSLARPYEVEEVLSKVQVVGASSQVFAGSSSQSPIVNESLEKTCESKCARTKFKKANYVKAQHVKKIVYEVLLEMLQGFDQDEKPGKQNMTTSSTNFLEIVHKTSASLLISTTLNAFKNDDSTLLCVFFYKPCCVFLFFVMVF